MPQNDKMRPQAILKVSTIFLTESYLKSEFKQNLFSRIWFYLKQKSDFKDFSEAFNTIESDITPLFYVTPGRGQQIPINCSEIC